ncbi:efflux RND transporter periplasmic adaptor subunit [Thiolapillus sp.]|uniref:efflux RND transporter periplasmic adaptor subunit n=1 Tax=Thiolapillus sp. TaxID=2017437 RepID=UPI003AF7A44F
MFSKRPWIISLLLAVGLAAWLASGSINGDTDSGSEKQEESKTPSLIKVRVKTMHAQAVDQNITLYGRTEPNRRVTLKAEVDGRVVEILKQRGESVETGEALLKIALNDRPQMLQHARAELAQRQLEYEGASSLNTKGFQGKAEVARKKALLKESQARVAALQREIRNTVIKAPFTGVMLERNVEVGDYLSVGTPVATVVDLDPLVVRGDVTQRDIQHLHVGQQAIMTLASGEEHKGKIRYLSSVADEDTNTFRVEVALDNADGHLLGGLSVELQIPLEQIQAIKITPALMAINEAGVIGIKWVKDGEVQFTPIDVVRSDTDGTWIRGLKDEVQVITVGQAFVREGDKVETSTGKPGAS